MLKTSSRDPREEWETEIQNPEEQKCEILREQEEVAGHHEHTSTFCGVFWINLVTSFTGTLKASDLVLTQLLAVVFAILTLIFICGWNGIRFLLKILHHI